MKIKHKGWTVKGLNDRGALCLVLWTYGFCLAKCIQSTPKCRCGAVHCNWARNGHTRIDMLRYDVDFTSLNQKLINEPDGGSSLDPRFLDCFLGSLKLLFSVGDLLEGVDVLGGQPRLSDLLNLINPLKRDWPEGLWNPKVGSGAKTPKLVPQAWAKLSVRVHHRRVVGATRRAILLVRSVAWTSVTVESGRHLELQMKVFDILWARWALTAFTAGLCGFRGVRSNHGLGRQGRHALQAYNVLANVQSAGLRGHVGADDAFRFRSSSHVGCREVLERPVGKMIIETLNSVQRQTARHAVTSRCHVTLLFCNEFIQSLLQGGDRLEIPTLLLPCQATEQC